jgi:photosystem II stability/assembly factor-like uncharacterized protein
MTWSAALIFVSGAPSVLQASWRSLGPYGGGAEVVRAVPDKKGSVLAATRTGLLFASDNGGASWTNVPFPEQFAGVLHVFEIDPRSGKVWYAGIEGSSAQSSGVYKTTDSGQSWTLLAGTKGIAVWSLAFSPSNPDVIAAGADSGVYVTRDGGAGWKLISPPGDPELKPVVSLAFDPVDNKIIYAGTTHLPWRTRDGGATWQSIHTGMIDDSDVFSIQVDPHRPERVLASACSGAYASGDAAGHWKRLNTPAGAFRTYFTVLDPRHPDTVFAGTSDGLLKSVNDGAVWRKVSLHAVKSISFDRFVPGRIFFASADVGLLLSTDNGDTLREDNIGFANRAVTSLTGSGDALYLSSALDLFSTDELALRWKDLGAGPEAGRMLVVSAAPDAPRTLFGAGYRGLFESVDGGKTWEARRGLADSIRVKSILPLAHGVVLAGTDQGLFRGNAAGSWNRVAAAAVERLQSAGTRIAAVNSRAALVSEDGGLTWRECATPMPGTVLYGLALDPANASAALAATSRGLYRSADGCRSWTGVTDGLEQATTEAVLFHPTRSGEAFVAQGGRVFRSTDGGRIWQPLDGSDLWPSSLLILASAPDRLFALVPGRGVFSTTASAEPAVTQHIAPIIQSSGRL